MKSHEGRVTCHRLLLLVLVLAGLLSPVGACTCRQERRQGPEPLLSPSRAPTPKVSRSGRLQRLQDVTRRTPLVHEMEQMQRVAEELRRRAAAGYPMKAPAIMMARIVKKIPAKRFPSTFQAFLDDLGDRLQKLQNSEDLRRDFNGMLDSCTACHRVYSRNNLVQLKRLRIKPAVGKRSMK